MAGTVVLADTARGGSTLNGSAWNDNSSSAIADTYTVAPTDVGNDPHDTEPAATINPAMVNPFTQTPTVNNTDTPVPTDQPMVPGQVYVVPAYGDCGGPGFNYAAYMPEAPTTADYTRITCGEGFRCQSVEGSDIYQCKEWPSLDPVPFYGQCGGDAYDGQTFCAPGAVCKYIIASFSQCLPTY